MSTLAPPGLQAAPVNPAPQRRGRLALALQEALTAGARLRANRQVAADADSFRNQVKHLLGRADQEARQAGYDPADVKLAIYGYIAFLDESVLNSGQPMFAGWPRRCGAGLTGAACRPGGARVLIELGMDGRAERRERHGGKYNPGGRTATTPIARYRTRETTSSSSASPMDAGAYNPSS